MKRIYSICIALSFSTCMIAQTYNGPKKDINEILENIKIFSSYVMASDYEKIANSYTSDAKIFPNGLDILDNRKEIIGYCRKDYKLLIIKSILKKLLFKET